MDIIIDEKKRIMWFRSHDDYCMFIIHPDIKKRDVKFSSFDTYPTIDNLTIRIATPEEWVELEDKIKNGVDR